MNVWRKSLACFLLPWLLVTEFGTSQLAGQENAVTGSWNRFRGPNGSGVDTSAELPIDLQPHKAVWNIKLAGSGHSSPVISGGQIFVTSYTPAGELVLQSLELSSGKQTWIWKTPLSRAPMHTLNSPASSTPALDSDNAYLLAFEPGHLRLFAINLKSGEKVWDRDFGAWTAQHGFAASPIVVDNQVVLVNSQEVSQNGKPTANEMIAVHSTDGTDSWRRPLSEDKASYSVPLVLDQGEKGSLIISTTTAEGIYATAAASGKAEWQVANPLPDRPVGSAILHGRTVYAACGSGGGGKLLTAIDLDSPGRSPRFELHQSVSYVPTPIFVNQWLFLFADSGIVSCIDPEKGDSVWRERISEGFWGSPVSDGRNLYCMDKAGVVHIIAADKQFRQTGKFPLGEATSATPAISHGKLILRTESSLSCFARTPEPEQ